MSAGTARDKSHWNGIYALMCLIWQGQHITYKVKKYLNS